MLIYIIFAIEVSLPRTESELHSKSLYFRRSLRGTAEILISRLGY